MRTLKEILTAARDEEPIASEEAVAALLMLDTLLVKAAWLQRFPQPGQPSLLEEQAEAQKQTPLEFFGPERVPGSPGFREARAAAKAILKRLREVHS